MKIKLSLFCSYLFFYTNVFNQSSLNSSSTIYNTFFTELNNELWVTSIAVGFDRFNGISTEHYLLGDSISFLKGTFIQSNLYKDKVGRLWTTTYENLCFFDYFKRRFNCYSLKTEKEILKEEYKIIHLDENQTTIWLSAGGQLISYDAENQEIIENHGATQGNYFIKWRDTIVGAPWLNAPGFELWTKQPNNVWYKYYFNFKNCEPNLQTAQVIEAIHIENELYLVSNQGLLLFDNKKTCPTQIFRYPNQSGPVKLEATVYQHYILLFNDSRGILVFNTRSKKYVTSIGLDGDKVYDLFISQNQDAYISINGKGVKKIDIQKYLGDENTINSKSKWSAIKKSNGLTLLLDKDHELKIFKDGVFKTITFPNDDLREDRIVSAEILDSNKVIFCGRYQCYVFDWKSLTWKLRPLTSIGQIQGVKSFDKKIYIISDSKIFSFDQTSVKEISIPDLAKYNSKYQFFGHLSPDVKTFSSSSSKLLIIQPSKDTSIDLGSFVNAAIYDENKKAHFAATNDGLIKVDSLYKVVHLTKNNELISGSSIFHLEQDQKYVYFNTESRLGSYDKTNGKIRFFTKKTFESRPAFTIDNDSIFIATDYLSSYSISDAFSADTSHDLVIDYFMVKGIKWNMYEEMSKSIQLNHDQNTIKWRAYVNHWDRAELGKVKYKIDPIMMDWELVENGKEIEYPFSLLPDQYILSIQGIKPTGDLTEIQTIQFRIKPPWHKTVWFKTMMAFIFIGAVYLIYRNRISRMEKAHEIENEINRLQKSALQAQMNPHFIFNCLNSIQGFIMKNQKEAAMEYLSKFAKLIRQYLLASTEDTITIENEMAMLEAYCQLESLRFDGKFEYAVTSSSDHDLLKSHIPPMLIQPFVENAIIHGMKGRKRAGGKININFDANAENILISIKDNGGGILPDKINKAHRSLGVSITQNRLAHIYQGAGHQYDIAIDSNPKGTTVSVTIPR